VGIFVSVTANYILQAWIFELLVACPLFISGITLQANTYRIAMKHSIGVPGLPKIGGKG
jgi:hypothetical protein